MAHSEEYYDRKVEEHNKKMLSKIVNTTYPTNPKFKDLSGCTYIYLYVDHYIGEDSHKDKYYFCKCKCGRDYICRAGWLQCGSSKSCGCYNREFQRNRITEYNKIEKVKHNGHGTRLYNAWVAMRQRCFNPNHAAFSYYGGRGITVCEEWNNLDNGFEKFKEWSLNNGYNDKLSIDRIDNDWNYCPDNCRWVSMKVQSNNNSNNRLIQIDRWVFPISIWSEILKINKGTIENRLNLGWREIDAVLVPTLPSYVRYKPGEMPHQIFSVPSEMEIYNKYDEWIKKGIILPVEETIYKGCT